MPEVMSAENHNLRWGNGARCCSMAFRSFWLTTRISAGVLVSSYRTSVSPRRSVGSFAALEWRMNVRFIPRADPKRPASNTTLSRGDA